MLSIERVQQLIKKGEVVLQTHRPNPPNVIGFPTLNTGEFASWQAQVLNYLKSNLPLNNQYLLSFEDKVKRGFRGDVQQGIGLLNSIAEDLSLGLLTTGVEDKASPIDALLTLFNRFHLVVRQLRSRHDSRLTLSIVDEYDVQDLLHALLVIYFDDIRAEEWTPSYAGKSNRMNFLLKDYKIVIEVKKTRNGLTGKEVGSQLIEDIVRYQQHQDCEVLLCFVYDPEGFIGNPKGLENDLSKEANNLKVRVYVRP
jgi:hypothetical protein